ncbi:MAG TPA: aldehyde dehydrogenase family protein [Actinomycetota bacterium]|nr:aldehyde dehydrogenase family protein [Actinomycetota bacterium]
MSETLSGAEPRMLIDGKLVEAVSGKTFTNFNPATEEAIGEVSDASPDDARTAIAAARRAFDTTDWSTDHKFRRHCLEQLHGALVDAKEEFRLALIAETGSPTLLTYLVQIDQPIDWFTFWPELADSYDYEGPIPDIDFMGMPHKGMIIKEPVGVVGAITPFNFPLYLNLAKLGPALAAGCTIVLKPSPETPWSANLIGRLIAEQTDIPPGVVNIVTSSDPAVGEVLTTDPDVDMVSFTGSTAVGKKIMAACAETVKKCHLELGGKSANILLDDADFSVAAGSVPAFVCAHSGQGCALYTRLLLPRSRYDEGLELVKAGFESMTYGDPMDASNLQGPQISARQRERVLEYIETAKKEGAKVLVGGGTPDHLEKGYYVQPTILTDVDPDSTVAQEEIFGPVLVVIPFDDDDDAVQIANNSRYGLSGAVWSASEERALSVARRIRSGTIGVNGGQWLHASRPFGGYRESGLGRENGVEGFEQYLETKVVALAG